MTAAAVSLLAARVASWGLRRRAARGQGLVVLVASPLRWRPGDPPALVGDDAALAEAARRLLAAGHVAVAGEMVALPLLAAGAGAAAGADGGIDGLLHAVLARIARRCDAGLRVGGPSRAADAAARICAELGLPVFRRLADVPGCG